MEQNLPLHNTCEIAPLRKVLLHRPGRELENLMPEYLELYTPEQLRHIIKRSARILEIDIDEGGSLELAKRSRGTPRIANRLLKRVRDFAQVRANGVITEKVAQEALNMLEIDPLGLDSCDRRILTAMIQKFGGGPVGLETLAAALSEDVGTLEDV